MPLTLYAVDLSQCDRLVWLCEELTLLNPSFSYTFHQYARGLADSEGKQKLLSLHPSGTSPTIVDDTVTPPVCISESQACLEYILAVHAQGRFTHTLATHSAHDYAAYLYWMSFANGSFQAWLTINVTLHSLCAQKNIDIDEERKTNLLVESHLSRTPNHLAQYETQLAKTRYLCGDEICGVDFMNLYGLTTMRGYYDLDLSPYPNILRYLKLVTDRPAYRAMLAKTADGMPPLIEGRVRQFPFELMLRMMGWRGMFSEEELAAEGGVTMEKKEGSGGGREDGHVGRINEMLGGKKET